MTKPTIEANLAEQFRRTPMRTLIGEEFNDKYINIYEREVLSVVQAVLVVNAVVKKIVRNQA